MKSSNKSKSSPSAEQPTTQPQMGIDPALVEALAGIVEKHHLTEVEVEHEGLHIRVARHAPSIYHAAAPSLNHAPVPMHTHAPAAPQAAAPAPGVPAVPASSPPADHPGVVKSPMVGTVYLRPSPDAKPFVDLGGAVKAGDRILLIEAMKTFNEIVAPKSGTLVNILVEDGQPVEYGEALMVIE